MKSLHLAILFRLQYKKFRIRRRVKAAKSKRVGGAVRKGYKNNAFTRKYLIFVTNKNFM